MSDYIARFTITGNSGTTDSWTGLGRLPPTIQRQAIHLTGTWSSATVILQYSIDGGTTWVAAPADKAANIVSLTANGLMENIIRYPLMRLSWTGGAGSVSLIGLVI